MIRETESTVVCDACGAEAVPGKGPFADERGSLTFLRDVQALDGALWPAPPVRLEDLCGDCCKGIAAAINAFKTAALGEIRFVCDGPPGPESGRFVELENRQGRGIGIGNWHERTDGLWELRIPVAEARGEVTSDGE